MDEKFLKALQSVPPQSLTGRPKYFKGFLFGDYGVGKTKVAGECAENKGLSIATDTGIETYYNHPSLVDKIEVVPYNGLSHLTAIGQAVAEEVPPYDEFDIIIVDTISQVQEEYLDYLNDNFTYAGNLREKAVPRVNAIEAKRLGLSEQEVLGLPDYHLTRNNMRHPIKTLIKAPINVMFIAHLREPTFMEQQKGKLVRRPTVTEAVFKLIAREASFMGLMERDGNKRTIQFKTDRKTVSKSRIAELDDKIINADDLPEILAKWRTR
jgi:AAA domain